MAKNYSSSNNSQDSYNQNASDKNAVLQRIQVFQQKI